MIELETLKSVQPYIAIGFWFALYVCCAMISVVCFIRSFTLLRFKVDAFLEGVICFFMFVIAVASFFNFIIAFLKTF